MYLVIHQPSHPTPHNTLPQYRCDAQSGYWGATQLTASDAQKIRASGNSIPDDYVVKTGSALEAENALDDLTRDLIVPCVATGWPLDGFDGGLFNIAEYVEGTGC